MEQLIFYSVLFLIYLVPMVAMHHRLVKIEERLGEMQRSTDRRSVSVSPDLKSDTHAYVPSLDEPTRLD